MRMLTQSRIQGFSESCVFKVSIESSVHSIFSMSLSSHDLGS